MSVCSSGSAGGSGSGGGGGGGGVGGPCGACKFLRRKCVHGCIFAPYFDAEQGASHFAAVHKVFGASNVSKLLLHLPKEKRLDAVVTICYEAQARLRDPVYGCVGHIFALHQQVMALQTELSYLHAHLASLEMPPPPPPVPMPVASFSVENLPTSAVETPATLDLSALFDPMVQPSMWAPPAQQQQQFGGRGDDGALQALARELLDRDRAGSSSGSPSPHPPTSK